MIFKKIQLNTPKVSEVKADFRNYVNKPELRKTVHKFLFSVFIFNNVKRACKGPPNTENTYCT